MAGTWRDNSLIGEAGLRSGITTFGVAIESITEGLNRTLINNRWRAVRTRTAFRRDMVNASDNIRPLSITRPVFTETPSAVALVLSLTTPVVSYSVSPAALALSLSIVAPQLNVKQYPSALALSLSTVTPTVTPGAYTLTPSAVVLALDTVDPTVGIGGFILPVAQALVLSIGTPTLTMGAVSVSPSALSLALSVTTGKTVLTQYPSALPLVVSLGTPTTKQTVNPGAVAIELDVTTQGVSNDLAALALELSLPEPTLIFGRRLLQPAPLILGLGLPYTLGSTTTVTNSAGRRALRTTYSITITSPSHDPVTAVVSRIQGSKKVQFATVAEYGRYQWQVYIAFVLNFYREQKALHPDDAEVQLETTQWITFLESLNIPDPVSPGNKDDIMVAVPNAAAVLPTLQPLLTAKGLLHVKMEVTYSDGGVMWFNLAQGQITTWDRNKGPRQDTLTIRCQQLSPWFPANPTVYEEWTSQKVSQFSSTSTDGTYTVKVPAGAGDPNLPEGFFYGVCPGDSLVLPGLSGTLVLSDVSYEISASGGSVTLKG